MKKLISIYLLLLAITISAQQLKITVLVTDQDMNHKVLVIGVDENAVNGLDKQFEEKELPPMPPAGVFDTRIQLPASNMQTWVDIREGNPGYSATYKYKLIWQHSSDATLPGVLLKWNLPENTSIDIKDLFGGVVLNYIFGEGENQLYVYDNNIKGVNITLTIHGEPKAPAGFYFDENTGMQDYTFSWFLTTEGRVKIILYDSTGNSINIISDQFQQPGKYSVDINPAQLNFVGGAYKQVLEYYGSDNKLLHKEERKVNISR